jgi:hypothetical protein
MAALLLAYATSSACGGSGASVEDDAGVYTRQARDAGSRDAAILDATISPGSDVQVDPPPDQDSSCWTNPSTSPGSWLPLVHQPTFISNIALLLTDGTVMVHEQESEAWWRLTPDVNGSYRLGSWTQLSPMPAGYAPLWFASAVLPDGRVLIEGGEYNGGTGPAHQVYTNLGAIYDPKADAWQPVAPPVGWTTIGDAPSVVLPNGTFMLGSVSGGSNAQALFDAATLTWTSTGTGKADSNGEEGWTLLPNGSVLVIDTSNGTETETYDPAAGTWSDAGSTSVPLATSMTDHEIGPATVMPDGRVFAVGATGHTAVRGTDGKWTQGPDFPCHYVDDDGSAILLPNGHVLVSVGQGNPLFFEFDGASLHSLPTPAGTPTYWTLLLLPTGEVLGTGFTTNLGQTKSSPVELYAPSGSPDPSWAPTITAVPTTLARGATYSISGTQFNGLSQAVSYGDDVQAATNYPLVRITNNATAHVTYARTHDHSTMAVATGSKPVSTSFDVPTSIETGASELVVVANGIASSPVTVSIE